MSDDDTQLICDPEATAMCPCTDEPYDCQCDASEDGVSCTACGATLVRININSGERVSVVA